MSDRIYVRLQLWSCDKCNAVGEVEAPVDLSWSELSTRIHNAHQKSAPRCDAVWSDRYLRLAQTAPLPD
jgi:hypothetical protein